jgi:hypothetical protein
MNLKFAVVSFGICLFGSALSMNRVPCVAADAQFIEYSDEQNEAIATFVNKVGDAWAEEEKEMIHPEGGQIPLLRTVSQHPDSSDDNLYYRRVIREFHYYPSKDMYKRCLEAQLRMGILNLGLLEFARPPRSRDSAFYPTPEKMMKLLPDLVEKLGLRVVYPENHV